MVVDVGVEVKGGVLQYPLREEGTMGRETETKHGRPSLEYTDRDVPTPAPVTLRDEGVLGRIYEIQDDEGNTYFGQLVESKEDDNDEEDYRFIDPTDGICWYLNGKLLDCVIVKRYNARLVLTEVK